MKTYTKEECKKIISKLNKELIKDLTKEESRQYLSRENNLEARDVKGYHGRELLELLQNADDAYQKSINLEEKPADDLIVKIKYFDNKLTISNTGTFFDESGIVSIILGNNSNKDKKEYIGNKGTGFRSVLNWADNVKIFSGNFNIEFSKDIAKRYFDEIKGYPQIKKQRENNPNLHIPMLSVAEYLDVRPSEYPDKETTIELTINPEKQKDNYNVDKQLRDMDMNILLFLPNTTQIQIETNNEKIIYKRVKTNLEENTDANYTFSDIKITKCVNSEEKSEDYKLFERTITDTFKDIATDSPDVEKSLRMAIAVTDNKSVLENACLYTFFPLLGTKSPFNCIMHATYELGNQRNNIDNSSNNSKIIVNQMKFLLDVVQNYYIKNNEIEKAISLIIPNNISTWNKNNKKFNSGFHSFELEDEYLKMLKDVRIFQTVNDKLLSINDKPKLIGEELPDYFKGDNFDKVIKLYNQNELLLLNLLKDYFGINLDISEFELCNIISNEGTKWSTEQRVNCFIWWCESTRKSLPSLLEDSDGNWLKYGDYCYFLDGSFDGIQIPSWAKIKSLKKEYQEELIKQAGSDNKVVNIRSKEPKNAVSRIISQNGLYNCIKFNYIDRSTIISAINTSVDTYEKGVDFINWLWLNYGKDGPTWVPPNNINYKFPTIDNEIANSDIIYISKEYGNDLGEQLFDNNYKKICSIKEINISNEQKENFTYFILKFGVNKYPRIQKENIDIQNFKDFHDYIYQIINNSTYKSDSTYIKEIKCSFPFITNLTKILENISTTTILKWITSDEKLLNLLKRKELNELLDYKIDFTMNRGKPQSYNVKPVKNFMLYVFNNTKWVEINGKKYSPVEVLLDIYSKNNQLLKDLTPVITEEYKKELIKKLCVTMDELNSILTLFDFKTNILELSSNDFYGLMLKLSTLTNRLQSIEIYKSIYYLLDHTDINSARFEESDNKTSFFKEGKLYTQKKNFVVASKVYLPSTKIINKDKYDIINKPPRGNSENFIEVFGCKKFERNFSVDTKSIKESLCNNKFQKDFRNFKLYASAYNSLNKNIEKSFNNISITLVKQISVKYNDGKIESITDEYVETNESSTKWYVTVFTEDYNVNKLSACIENIFSNIAYTPGYDSGKIGEIFRARSEEDRRFLIENAGMIIQPESDFASEYKNKFERAVNKINQNIDLNKYDIDYNNIQCNSNIEKIIRLVKELNISSLNEIYNNGFAYKFDLTNYYKVEIRNFIDREKRNYKNYLYSVALNDTEKQESFLKDCYEFEEYNINDKVEEILDIKKFVEKKFGTWNSSGLNDAEEKYKENYISLNPNRENEDNIRNNNDAKTLIYFNKKEEFERWLLKEKSSLEHEIQQKEDPYKKYRNYIPEIELISYSEHTTKKQNVERNYRKKRAFSETLDAKKRKSQKILGNKGELIVYNWLCEIYGKDNVFPKSEAFVSLGLLEAGQEESAKCDIEYNGKDGKRYYVEVKSGDEFSFNISQDELTFAMEQKNYYKLYIVFDFDKEKPKCKLIDENFWENSKYKQEPIIETIHITF